MQPISLPDYYRRKGKPIRTHDSVLDEKYALYEKAAKEIERRFFGCEVQLFRDDEVGDDDDINISGNVLPFKREKPKIGRNDLCPCGSGKKFKKCCLEKLH